MARSINLFAKIVGGTAKDPFATYRVGTGIGTR